jgi:hypothetical protein
VIDLSPNLPDEEKKKPAMSAAMISELQSTVFSAAVSDERQGIWLF